MLPSLSLQRLLTTNHALCCAPFGSLLFANLCFFLRRFLTDQCFKLFFSVSFKWRVSYEFRCSKEALMDFNFCFLIGCRSILLGSDAPFLAVLVHILSCLLMFAFAFVLVEFALSLLINCTFCSNLNVLVELYYESQILLLYFGLGCLQRILLIDLDMIWESETGFCWCIWVCVEVQQSVQKACVLFSLIFFHRGQFLVQSGKQSCPFSWLHVSYLNFKSLRSNLKVNFEPSVHLP